jgi:hypothetical protein
MRRKLLASFALCFALLLLVAIPTLAVDIYLPALDKPYEIPEHLQPGNGSPTAEPVPTPTLLNGTYEYSDGQKRIYFSVSSFGNTVSDAGFYIRPSNAACGIMIASYQGSESIRNGKFAFADMSGTRLYSSLTCKVIANNQASCDVFDLIAGCSANDTIVTRTE